MRRLFLGAMAMLALGAAGPASAADLAARPYVKAPAMIAQLYDWSGFYVGANGGWATSRKCWDFIGIPGVPLPTVGEGCHDSRGAILGGQVGYNWQSGAWVVGAEAQGDWANLRGSNDPAAFPGTTNRTRIDALGLFTGRVGYAWNNALLYVKGGAAVAHDKYDFGVTGAPVAMAAASENRWGAAAGAGFEYGITPNWSAGVEYQHVFMGHRDVTFAPTPAVPTGAVERIRQDADLVNARVNYRWGGPVVAKY